MHDLPDIHSIDVRGNRVLLRASLNVPVKNGVVENDFRIRQSLEVIRMLVHHGARVVVIGHIGRNPTDTLYPVYEVLAREVPISWSPDTIGDAVEARTHELLDGEVLLVENVRRYPEETANDSEFAASLARLGDLYVNDAFADSHREHASIVGIPLFLPSYFGPAFIREYSELARARAPEHPSLCILGGAKFETKLPLVARFLELYDHVFIAGALANDVLYARGYEVGTSLRSAIDLTGESLVTDPRLIIPSDVIVTGPQGLRITGVEKVMPEECIVDVGPVTIASLGPILEHARTILWNGPLGNYEAGFDTQTHALAHVVAEAGAHTIIGGGDTVAAIEKLNLVERCAFLSSAGGAMLTFLESGTLAGIDAVNASYGRE